MATLDKTGGNSAVSAVAGLNKHFRLVRTIDLAAVATGDVVQCLSIPAKTLVKNVFVEVVTACSLTATATVGDGAGANSWDASTNLNAAAGTITNGASGTDAYALGPGKVYSAADTIDLTCTIAAGPIVAGSVKVTADCFDLS